MQRTVFYQFIDEMNKLLQSKDVTYRDQKELFEELFRLENEFKEVLCLSADGKQMFDHFIEYISVKLGNKLLARVYFRERQDTFSKHILDAFKKKSGTQLRQYRINYKFAEWVVQNFQGPHIARLRRIFKKIKKLRTDLCETNLLLALNKAKIFWSKVPESHLEYMDLIQTSMEGMIDAIDKYEPPYKSVFNSVAMSRMAANMMDDHNSTLVKLSAKDRRILYRVNMAKNREKVERDVNIVGFVQEKYKNVTQSQVDVLVSATSNISSIDNFQDQERSYVKVKQIAADDDVEDNVAKKQLLEIVLTRASELSIFEQKVLRMKFSLDLRGEE